MPEKGFFVRDSDLLAGEMWPMARPVLAGKMESRKTPPAITGCEKGVPEYTSGNTNASAIAIAEKGAEMVLDDGRRVTGLTGRALVHTFLRCL